MSAATEATLFRICDQSQTVDGMRHHDRLCCLTPRQMQVAYLVAVGVDHDEIAELIGVHVQTVRMHCHRIYQRLGLIGGNQRVKLAELVWAARGV